jgi:uncharacterized protein YgbK (DUF1537 family)
MKIEISPALPSLFSRFTEARNNAFHAAGDAVAAASALGAELERHEEQLELQAVVDAVDGMSIQQARACIKVAKIVREHGGVLDNAMWRQTLLLTELVPAPEPRNPEPGKPIKILLWMSRIRSRIPRLNPEERGKLKVELQRLLQLL